MTFTRDYCSLSKFEITIKIFLYDKTKCGIMLIYRHLNCVNKVLTTV
jgi:hypothetical protein